MALGIGIGIGIGIGGGAGGMASGAMKVGGGMPGGTGAVPGAHSGPTIDEGMMKQTMTNHQAMQSRMNMMEMMTGQMLRNEAAQQNVKPPR